MKLIIRNAKENKNIGLENYGLYVPRIGENVVVSVCSCLRVKDVVWDFVRGTITLVCEP